MDSPATLSTKRTEVWSPPATVRARIAAVPSNPWIERERWRHESRDGAPGTTMRKRAHAAG